MLTQFKPAQNDEQDSMTESPKKSVKALIKANLLMYLHFTDVY